MSTQSKNLKLVVPDTSTPFSTQDIADNWNKIDAAPGTFICTSSSRPTWAANQAGRKIYETDTDLDWTWTGTTWKRTAAKGLLTRTTGEKAIALRETDFTTTSTTPVIVLAITNVVVPPGNRTLVITFSWSRAYSTTGYFYARVFRSNTANTGPQIGGWAINGVRTDPVVEGNRGAGGTMSVYEANGLPAGTYSWSLQVFLPPGVPAGETAVITGTPTYPNIGTVEEI